MYNEIHSGIDVILFEPFTPEIKLKGRLYLNIPEAHYVEIKGGTVQTLKVVFAIDENGKKYSLLNCEFKRYQFPNTWYIIKELYKGEYIEEVTKDAYNSVVSKITFLTEWFNHPRIKPTFTFSENQSSEIQLKEMFVATFKINETKTIKIGEFYSASMNRHETQLINDTEIHIVNTNTSRFELYKDLMTFSKFLALFSNRTPQVKALTFESTFVNEIKLVLPDKISKVVDNGEVVAYYTDVEEHWPSILTNLYNKRDVYLHLLELFVQSKENLPVEVSFLNITTAIEFFHVNFMEAGNNDVKNEISEELRARNIIAGKRNEWTLIVRYFHLFQLFSNIDVFNHAYADKWQVLEWMRNSRNYYTHYSESNDKVWSLNELEYETRVLRQLVKSAILLQLGLPEKQVNKIVNAEPTLFYTDYESNEYSLHYKRKGPGSFLSL